MQVSDESYVPVNPSSFGRRGCYGTKLELSLPKHGAAVMPWFNLYDKKHATFISKIDFNSTTPDSKFWFSISDFFNKMKNYLYQFSNTLPVKMTAKFQLFQKLKGTSIFFRNEINVKRSKCPKNRNSEFVTVRPLSNLV